uniref:Uncharacterized protein n=1 Tax=Anguilla anguilla TaxID=7936 RepID=A0A0E9RSF6_ANGAN
MWSDILATYLDEFMNELVYHDEELIDSGPNWQKPNLHTHCPPPPNKKKIL